MVTEKTFQLEVDIWVERSYIIKTVLAIMRSWEGRNYEQKITGNSKEINQLRGKNRTEIKRNRDVYVCMWREKFPFLLPPTKIFILRLAFMQMVALPSFKLLV